jgi:hypothetical protein
MTPQELIESNKAKLEYKRLELIDVIRSINKDTSLLEFRQINLLVENIKNDMSLYILENELVNQLVSNKNS